jgi:alpha-beta hydrolase superfamily lysophospholipase
MTLFRKTALSRWATIAALLAGFAPSVAAAPAVHAPASRAQAAPALERIRRERLSFPGADEPHTPAALNRVDAYRYAAETAPAAGGPDIVLVLIPGLNSGPNTLDLLARALVSRDPALEVWIAQPRAGILQDRRGVTAALEYGDPDFALGYYYGGLQIDGRQFTALNPMAVPSAAYWGLDLHLRDVRVVVTEVRRRYPDARVILGGHSLGGMMAALYAGYDFARAPGPAPVPGAGGIAVPSAEAGARGLSGLLLIDGVPLELPVHYGAAQYLGGLKFPFVGKVPGVNALLATDPRRRISPFTDTSAIARTRDSILFDIVSVYAYLRPDAASVLPFYPRDGLPITNEALLGAVLSDRMQPNIFIRASIGAPLGIFDRMPDPAGISRTGLLKLSTGRPAPDHTLIQWIPYDQTRPRGLVDLHALEAAILRPEGDFTQWYMPWRLLLDLGLSLGLNTTDSFSRQYVSLTQVRYVNLPMLILGAGRGLIRSPGMADFYLEHTATPRSRVRFAIFPDYTHLDIEDAANNRAVAAILDWLPGVPKPASGQ